MCGTKKVPIGQSRIYYSIYYVIKYIIDRMWLTVFLFASIGVLFSQFKLTMSKDAWFYFFSTIAQTFAALVALVAVFLIFRLELYNTKIDNLQCSIQDIKKDISMYKNSPLYGYITCKEKEIDSLKQKKEQDKNKMKALFSYTFPIIIISIFLIPLGYPSTENDLISTLWDHQVLKWAFIYSVVGLCVESLYKISGILGDFLS